MRRPPTLDRLPATQQAVGKFLTWAGQATVHTVAWHVCLYRKRGAGAVYKAIARLKALGLVETCALTLPERSAGAERQVVALTHLGGIVFGAVGAGTKAWRNPLSEPEAVQATNRQLAMVHCDYHAAAWRPLPRDEVWPALRQQLKESAKTVPRRGTEAELLALLLRRADADIGCPAFVSSTGAVRLVLYAATISGTRRLLRGLDAALFSALSTFIRLEMLVIGPSHELDLRMIELVKRWARRPPKVKVRVAKDGIDPAVRTGSRAVVQVWVEAHSRFEWLPNPREGGVVAASALAESRRKWGTEYQYCVPLIMTPEHPEGIREIELSHSEIEWLRRSDRNRFRPQRNRQSVG